MILDVLLCLYIWLPRDYYKFLFDANVYVSFFIYFIFCGPRKLLSRQISNLAKIFSSNSLRGHELYCRAARGHTLTCIECKVTTRQS